MSSADGETSTLSTFSKLQGVHSAITSIHTLYPDILRGIFFIVAQIANWEYQKYIPQVSHVCPYWRSIALETPQLWNRFRIQLYASTRPIKNSWIYEFKRRTKSALLHINLSTNLHVPLDAMLDYTTSVESLHQVFPDLRRAESLQVSGSTEIIQKIFKLYMDTRNPNIRHLTLWTEESTNALESLPIFGDDMPHLETLRFYGQGFNTLSSIFSFKSLKRLCVSPSRVSLHVFSSLSHSEELDVSIKNSSSLGSTVRDPVVYKEASLQALRRLDLNLPSLALTTQILGPMMFPSCTSLKLFIQKDNTLEAVVADLFSTVSRLVTTGTALANHPVHCFSVSTSYIVTKAWDDCQNLSVSNDHMCTSIRSFQSMGRISLFKLVRDHIHDSHEVEESSSSQSQLPQLEYFTPCPSLSHLTITLPGSEAQREILFGELSSILKQRNAALGRQLERLTMGSYTMTELSDSSISRLQEVVQNVDIVMWTPQ
ncbi:hypothetical protein AX16_009701 [Volvariella volvacea WC 439]|nr:hypothetical protein AX16_009701 [Volvariella volvacea WC 439]